MGRRVADEQAQVLISKIPTPEEQHGNPEINRNDLRNILLDSLTSNTAAPIFGALSDRYGRKNVLISCLLGSVIGYILFGIGKALWILFLGRNLWRLKSVQNI